MGLGYLRVRAFMANDAVPIENAIVTINDNDGNTLYTLRTDSSGITETVSLYAPDEIYSMDPNYEGIPYSTYQVIVSKLNLITEIINGVQIFDTEEALEEVEMHPVLNDGVTQHTTTIPPHKQLLNLPQEQLGPEGRVLHQVIIPDFITVHLGRFNESARNVRVPFPTYIKNVASSEIYPDWPNASLEANIRAIINFALNRVYTEWYRCCKKTVYK